MKVSRNILAPVMAFAILCTSLHLPVWAWDGAQQSEPTQQDGVYQIADAEQLAWFADRVNSGEAQTADAALTADIDLSDRPWTPIGNGIDAPYTGKFDGGGHTVEHLFIDATTAYQGLFGVIGETGEVRNLTLRGKATSTRTFLGGIAGRNAGTIEHCDNYATVENTATSVGNSNYIGGVAGQNQAGGRVIACRNYGDVSAFKLGGVVGYNAGTVTGCINYGAVTVKETSANTTVGGVVGQGYTNSVLYNSINAGTVRSNCTLESGYFYIGGVAGQQSTSKAVFNCLNIGTVSYAHTVCENFGEIVANRPASLTLSDNYHLADATDWASGAASERDLKSPEAVERLNANDGGAFDLSVDEALRYVAVADDYPTLRYAYADRQVLDDAVQALRDGWFRLAPKFGTDTNVIDLLSDKLTELGFSGLKISICESDPTYIESDGEIHYFYADPNGANAIWFATTPVTFRLENGGASVEYSVNATIHWDADKARAALQSQIVDSVTDRTIANENPSLNEVTSDLTLPYVVDGKKWSLITWESSDPNTLRIDDSVRGNPDSFYEPATGVVVRGNEDKQVVLTARFSFQYTTYDEPEISLEKRFTVTVKGLENGALRAQMQRELDENYTVEKLTDFATGATVDPDNVRGDIQLLIPSKTGVPAYDNYRFSVASDSDAAVVSGYRLSVYRPLPGEESATVTLTVTLSHKQLDLSVSKTIRLTIQPLTQPEIDAEIRLMQAAKADYFSGINRAANPDAAHITKNLSPFLEAVPDADGVRWIYTRAETTGTGIVPVSIDESHPSEAWDLFYSSAPSVISHETLLVTPPAATQTVTVQSCLSSETFEKYAVRYPDDPDFAKLYRQPVSAELTVLGTGGESAQPSSIQVTLRVLGDAAHGAQPHSAYTVWLQNAVCSGEQGATVMDVLRRTLEQNGYSCTGDQSVVSITSPTGVTLATGTNGANSGWMYAVNGKLAEVYPNAYTLKDGDSILWFYTDDYKTDDRIQAQDVVADPDLALPDYTAQWGSYRGSDANTNVLTGDTPSTRANTHLRWALALRAADDWSRSVSEPLLINRQLYIVVGGELLKIGADGQIQSRATLAGQNEYTCRPVYADGMVILPLSDGRFQAVAADSLKTVWLTEPLEPHLIGESAYAHQAISTLTVQDGRLYAATACADWESSYYGLCLCLDLKTGRRLWAHENTRAGYYWSGAVCVNGAVVLAGDDGMLTALDAETGAVKGELSLGAAVRSTVIRSDNFVAVTTTDGRLHRVTVQPDGSLTDLKSCTFAAFSTATPVVCDGVFYVGGAAADYSGVFAAIDAQTMTLRRTVSAPAEVKSAPLAVKTADGVMLYYTCNSTPGGVYAYNAATGAAAEIFVPTGAQANYCTASLISDGATLYYTNDSGYLFALEKAPSAPTTPSKPSKPSVSAPKNGTVTVNGKLTLYKNGKKVTGTKIVMVGGKTYAVKRGVVQTASKAKFKVIKLGKKAYIVSKKGVVQKNKMLKVGKRRYIVAKSGVIQKAKKKYKVVRVGKKRYIVNKKGFVQVKKKAIKVGKATYKTGKNGVAKKKK